MKFAAPYWLFGTGFALVVAAVLIIGGILLTRAVQRFGDEALVRGLLTANARGRRAFKGVLIVIAVALAFVALAQPQYGRGTRLIPATNLDVVIVLDYSKSMFARDISPSRTLRAKGEVDRLIAELPGARFGAVAFAGQPMAFPLTSDGAAIAQFFKQLSPNDMPIGGTAIARALEAGRELLSRDPLSKQHRKVMLLVTDGEDLEGDPVSVAQSAAQEEIATYLVQIGGRTPEPIPEVNEAGQVTGMRHDAQGNVLTTELSAEGEEQLAKIAQVGGGIIVRSERGETGINEVAARLKRLMTEELSEKVETIYADVYAYPLALCILLLLIETFIPEARARAATAVPPPPAKRPRRKKNRQAAAIATGLLIPLLLVIACDRGKTSIWDRNSPKVDEAIAALDAGDASAATSFLQEYLSTGKCEKGEIGTPGELRNRYNASFDLGLALFEIAESFGMRFGEEAPETDAGLPPEEEAKLARRREEVECALRIVRVIAADAALPLDLRARAHYLAGNLEFLRGDYRSAVKSYDASLLLIPGVAADAGDLIGRDAAHNRAIALRRIEEEDKKDAGNDAAPDADNEAGPPDGGPPDGGDGDSGDNSNDGGDSQDGGNNDDQNQDAGNDGGSNQDQEQDGGGAPDAGPQQNQPEPQPDPKSSANQDERMLDMLEQAPTLQEHDAKNRALQRGAGRMEDK